MGLQQVNPAADPLDLVPLADVKEHCTIESDAWDAMLTGYITAAIAMIEDYTGVAFGVQQWRLSLDAFGDDIELARGPVTAVTSITYRDELRALQTLSPAFTILDMISKPQRIVLDPDYQWPATARIPNAVTINFETGFAQMPALAKQAVLTTVASWFENREAGIVPAGALAMVRSLRGIVL